MRSKKSLGQNFLRNESVAKKLVDSANILPNDVVVEVGPGEGVITQFLLTQARAVIAVEKDESLVAFLQKKFSAEISSGKLILVCDDILNFNPNAYRLEPRAYKLVGSIPYYITGAFIRRFLSIDEQPETIALIIQKEVAERIVARDLKPLDSARGKESVLSISVKAYGEPRLIQKIGRGSFAPSPKVNSAIFVIENISKNFFKTITEKHFFSLLKRGFAHKRKLLLKNLEGEAAREAFGACKIEDRVRAEDISLANWKCLIEKLKMQK